MHIPHNCHSHPSIYVWHILNNTPSSYKTDTQLLGMEYTQWHLLLGSSPVCNLGKHWLYHMRYSWQGKLNMCLHCCSTPLDIYCSTCLIHTRNIHPMLYISHTYLHHSNNNQPCIASTYWSCCSVDTRAWHSYNWHIYCPMSDSSRPRTLCTQLNYCKLCTLTLLHILHSLQLVDLQLSMAIGRNLGCIIRNMLSLCKTHSLYL